MNYIFFFLIVNFVVLFAKKENYTINFRKQKRDACDNQAVSIVSQSIFSITESISKGSNILGLGSNFFGLLQSVFGFNAPTTCELNQKLDLILLKLDEISKDIKNTAECSNIKQDYGNDIIKKSMHLISLFSHHQKTPFKEQSKKNIIETCLHKTEGISKLLSSFNKILEDDSVIDEFKYCCEYKKNEIDKWAQKIRKFTLVFVSLVLWCEDAYGYETDFDPYTFIQDVEKRVNFHIQSTLIESFVNDQGPNGIYQSILHVLKKNTDSDNNVKELGSLYSYFHWGVIRYSVEMHGTYRWSSDYKYNQYHTIFFGELHYRNKDELEKSAVVYWSVCSSFMPGLKNELRILEPFCAHPNTLSYSSQIDFLQFLCLQSRTDLTDLNCIYLHEENSASPFRRQKYYCFQFNIYKSWKEKPVISSMSNLAIIFPTKNQENQFLMTKSLNLDTRLYGHFKETNATSTRKCRNACLHDNECIASSFTEQNWTNPCFLYKKGYKKSIDQKGWSTYIRNFE